MSAVDSVVKPLRYATATTGWRRCIPQPLFLFLRGVRHSQASETQSPPESACVNSLSSLAQLAQLTWPRAADLGDRCP